jgi:DNA-binding response OmpR family regulator
MVAMKALVVEDDPRIVEMVEDVLFSLDFEYDSASNQQDAKRLLSASDYGFVLLDLQIPAKANRGGADKEYGINLLKDIQRLKQPSPPPVIMMTAHVADCLDLSADLQRSGVREFISKPFSKKGRSLASVIRKVLDKPHKAAAGLSPKSGDMPVTQAPFVGGTLAFHADCVTLCDVTVLVNSRARHMRRILDELRQRRSNGSYVARSGRELASLIGTCGGQNSVAGAVRDFRRAVAETLREELNLSCSSHDVIRSGGPGYRLNEWISIGDSESTGAPALTSDHPPTEDSPLDRRDRILAEIRGGSKLRAPAIAAKLGCATRTVKRELEALRTEGLIEFVGPSKTGFYCVRKDNACIYDQHPPWE